MSAFLLRHGAVVPTSYITNFPLTEDPISEVGKWVTGKTTGLDWNDPQTDGTKCYADTNAGLSGNAYDDSLAHLKTSFRTFTGNQYAQGTTYLFSGYNGNTSSHECELLLRFAISGHSATGYECSVGLNTAIGSGFYAFIVRWNGTIGNFTALIDPANSLGSYTNTPTAPTDGDIWRAEITGNSIALKQNGTVILSTTDSTYASGQPGFGFWPSGSLPDKTKFGWKQWQADNI